MPATVASLSRTNGFQRFYCPLCQADVLLEDDLVEEFCSHLRLFVDWIGEPTLATDASHDLAARIEEIDAADPAEVAALFGENDVVFHLAEEARGGGHDGSSCLAVIAFGE